MTEEKNNQDNPQTTETEAMTNSNQTRNQSNDPNVTPVDLGEIDDQSEARGPRLPSSLLDPIRVDLTVELGRTRMTFRELQMLTQGTVIELEHLVGDPLEIRANGHLVARGEVVAVKQEHYGVRITEVVHPERALEEDEV